MNWLSLFLISILLFLLFPSAALVVIPALVLVGALAVGLNWLMTPRR